MRIYTGQTTGTKLEKLIALDLGICITTSPHRMPSRDFGKVPCILDNGAYSCWKKGYSFQEEIFLKTIAKAYACSINLDFIVCPDIVAGGRRSLEFSYEWATGKLKTCQRLALAVQDGIEPRHIKEYGLDNFTHIFVGGTVSWKWNTVKQWIDFAHDNKMKCHIGRCGTFANFVKAYKASADSVDSTSITRNESWNHIKEFYAWKEKEQSLWKLK